MRWLGDAQLPAGLAPRGAQRLTIAAEGPIEVERLLAELAPRPDERAAGDPDRPAGQNKTL